MRRTSVIAMVVVGLVAVVAAWGQQGQSTPRPADAAPASAVDAGPLADLSFAGGTVRDYVELVRRTWPGANVVVDDRAHATPVPRMQLTGLREQDAIGVLGTLMGEVGLPMLTVIRKDRFTTIGVVRDASRTEPTTTETWSLRPLIDSGMKVDDLLTAVRTALELGGGDVEIKYHDETALLVSRGKLDQLRVIEQVLSRLERTGTFLDLSAWQRQRGEMAASLLQQQAELTALTQRVVKLEAATAPR